MSDHGGTRHRGHTGVPDAGEGELPQVGAHDEGEPRGHGPLERGGVQLCRAARGPVGIGGHPPCRSHGDEVDDHREEQGQGGVDGGADHVAGR
jgi:hypothetical protein